MSLATGSHLQKAAKDNGSSLYYFGGLLWSPDLKEMFLASNLGFCQLCWIIALLVCLSLHLLIICLIYCFLVAFSNMFFPPSPSPTLVKSFPFKSLPSFFSSLSPFISVSYYPFFLEFILPHFSHCPCLPSASVTQYEFWCVM